MIVSKRKASVENVFVGEGRYTLALTIGPLMDLEENLNIGLPALMQRFLATNWRTKDVREIIRLGLIGGGMAPEKAFDLVNSHVVSAHLQEHAITATVLLQAALFGVEDDPVGEPQPPVTETPAAEHDGPVSTKSAAPPGSRRKKSTE